MDSSGNGGNNSLDEGSAARRDQDRGTGWDLTECQVWMSVCYTILNKCIFRKQGSVRLHERREPSRFVLRSRSKIQNAYRIQLFPMRLQKCLRLGYLMTRSA